MGTRYSRLSAVLRRHGVMNSRRFIALTPNPRIMGVQQVRAVHRSKSDPPMSALGQTRPPDMPPAVAACVQAARAPFLQILPEGRESRCDFVLGKLRVEKKKPLVKSRYTIAVGLDLVIRHIAGAWKNRTKKLARQTTCGDVVFAQNEIAVVAGREAALDFEEIRKRRPS
jgi:hypothetical protein